VPDDPQDQEERQIDPRVIRIVRMTLILLPILMFALPEVLGRVYYHFKVDAPGKSYGMWTNDPVAGGIPKPNSYSGCCIINNEGFRNPDDLILPKPPKSRRVIAYGGSTTFCYNVKDDESWPLQLQALLREEPGHSQDEVLNAGVINWSLGHALVRAKREIPEYKPDYITVYSGFNEWKNADHLDAEGISIKDLVAQKQYGVVSKNLPQSSGLLQSSLLYRFFLYNIQRPLADLTGQSQQFVKRKSEFVADNHPYYVENYIHVLRELYDLARANGAELVFITQTALTPDRPRFKDWLIPSLAGTEPAREMGATVLMAEDFVASYEGDPADLFYTSGIHYSKDGNQRFAKFIYDKVFKD